ncbi:MAG: hypothetical protein JRN15_12165 [Nitrososphaerota archaeon]|nr:hypothetical protein [Nitrososphaerota archaeon]
MSSQNSILNNPYEEPRYYYGTNIDGRLDYEDRHAAALTHMSNSSDNSSQRGHVWCLVRKDRNISRTVGTGSHAFYSDAPDTTRTEGNVARQTAVDIPMLIMLRQNGEEDKGWHGAPFYWPVIVAQQNIRTAIFAHETTP